MTHRSRFLLLALSAVLATALIGCAKKPVATTPVPPSQTPTDTAPTPPSTPAPETAPQPTTQGTATSKDLQIVYFAYDSFILDDGARAALDANAKVLRDNAGLNVSVDGHCDERGTVEYNQALGQKRADAVAQYLSDQGIEASRLRVISYGKERPADEGHDEAAWAKNRRVEFSGR